MWQALITLCHLPWYSSHCACGQLKRRGEKGRRRRAAQQEFQLQTTALQLPGRRIKTLCCPRRTLVDWAYGMRACGMQQRQLSTWADARLILDFNCMAIMLAPKRERWQVLLLGLTSSGLEQAAGVASELNSITACFGFSFWLLN